MIQRIQSIYLLLTTALMAVFLFLPIAQFDTTDGIYSFTAQGISTVEAMTTLYRIVPQQSYKLLYLPPHGEYSY